VREHGIARDGPFGVRQAEGEGEAGAGGGEGGEAEVLQIAGSTHVPGIRHEETAAFVEFPEGGAASGEGGEFHRGRSI